MTYLQDTLNRGAIKAPSRHFVLGIRLTAWIAPLAWFFILSMLLSHCAHAAMVPERPGDELVPVYMSPALYYRVVTDQEAQEQQQQAAVIQESRMQAEEQKWFNGLCYTVLSVWAFFVLVMFFALRTT